MKRRLSLGLVALAALAGTATLALSSGGASAAPAPRDTYGACLKHAQSTFDMDQCVGNERKRLKPLLAGAYNKLLTDPDSNAHRRHLIALSEKAWTTYEKRDCAYVGSSAQGGTLEPIIEGECLVDRARTRIKDLRGFAVPLGR
ncbi:MAG TPA: lysozyme inhibitor LprI family protein [Thermoleophilaceae bacterium]